MEYLILQALFPCVHFDALDALQSLVGRLDPGVGMLHYLMVQTKEPLHYYDLEWAGDYHHDEAYKARLEGEGEFTVR